MDRSTVLAAFDDQMRKHSPADGSGARIERFDDVVRYLAAEGGSSAIVWSDLGETSVDRAIAEQIRYFAALGRSFEWKHYAHDRPADLPERLVAAGFERGEEETLMVAETANLDVHAAPPPEVRLLPIVDAKGVATLVQIHDDVFARDHGGLEAPLLAQIAHRTAAAVLAMDGPSAVGAGRVEFHPGTEFASLWGGGIQRCARRRGIYRALVAYRARLAAERGYRYVQVDASPASRPILERLGFERLTTTTPYLR